MHPLRASCHYFVQQLPQSPLPEVSDGGTRSLDRRASKELLPTRYVHVVFTLPASLAPLTLQNKKFIYGLLLQASAETLLEVACDPDTSARNLVSSACCTLGTKNSVCTLMSIASFLPAVESRSHALDKITLAIFSLHPSASSCLSRQVRRRSQQAFHSGRLSFRGNLAALAQPKTFAAWLRSLFRKDWVVYAKRPFGGPEYVLQYLGRYTHRVAISNHRLVSFTGGKVTFRWRDSAHDNEQKLLTLTLDEFLRRFLLHLLPKVSYAFAILVSWPIGDAPLSCRYAFTCLARHKSRRRIKMPLARTASGVVPSVVDRWWRRKALRCGNPTSLPNHGSLLPHETPLSNPNPSRLSACSVFLRLNTEQNSILNFLDPSSTILSCPSPFPAPSGRALPHSLRNTPHRCPSHSISIGPASAANHKRLPSSRLIERARAICPALLPLPKRASD